MAMKKYKKVITLVFMLAAFSVFLTGCSELKVTTATGTKADTNATKQIADTLSSRQPTPTDIEYSLERYNLIRRAYWVNGKREKANTVVCPVEKPLGYIVLFAGNTVVNSFIVDGKVSSLNSYLSPDSEYYEYVYGGTSSYLNKWLADVDGSYGENDNGIFFFTPNGNYIEWTGEYLYSDIPFEVEKPTVRYEVKNDGK